MPIRRRDFLKFTGAAAAAAGLPLALAGAKEPPPQKRPNQGHASHTETAPQSAHPPQIPQTQTLHPDYQSNNDGTEYFFLGNGLITAAIQTSLTSEAGTHCGLLVMSPEHFGRKASTFLYHPERGLQNSLFNLVVNGAGYNPHTPLAAAAARASDTRTKSAAPSSSGRDWSTHASNVHWIYPDAIPTVAIDWHADACTVHEELYCPSDEAAIIRTVTVRNASNAAARATGYCSLYPNLMLFDEYAVDRAKKTLTAQGFAALRMFSPDASSVGDRHLYFEFGELAPGASKTATIVLTLNTERAEFERRSLDAIRTVAGAYWSAAASLTMSDRSYDHLFNASKSALRAAVARSGKMDGGIWQYNLEWVRDQSMVASACAMMGRTDIAESLLRRMLTHSIDEHGGTVDASRTRPPETMELDQNGELLYALWMHWMWSGSDALIRESWDTVARIADYVLRPEFRDPSIGLLKNSREYWERDPGFGVKDGYELTYQMWNILGLAKAAEMAAMMHDDAKARTWREASDLMKRSFLSHPTYSLVYEQRFIKRRAADGTPQFTFEPKNRKAMPPGMPLNVEQVSYCDPDSSNVFPIVYGIVDATGEIARNTLRSMDALWNQRWSTGGYGRYHVTSEPDSPGAWPVATVFIARAALEAGDDDRVVRVLSWLKTVKGGHAGTWLEFFGERPVPPLPPVGVVVWNWAEIVMFFMHHLLGVRPEKDALTIRPRLFKGVDSADAQVPVRGGSIRLMVRRAEGAPFARVNGMRQELEDGMLRIPYDAASGTVEIFI